MFAVSVLHYFNTSAAGLPTGGLQGYTLTGFATIDLANTAALAILNNLKSNGTNADGTVHTKVTAFQMT